MVGSALGTAVREDGSVLQNHLGHRLLRRVRDRQSHILDSEFHREFSSPPVECHRRTASRHADYLAIAPPHSMIPAGAERLHGGLFGGEACGIALEPVRLRIAIAHLSRGEDALQKTLPEALHRMADAGNFGDVDARAYDHERSPLALKFTATDLTATGLHDRSIVRQGCELLALGYAA